jgi:hypothetical protein
MTQAGGEEEFFGNNLSNRVNLEVEEHISQLKTQNQP